MLVTRWIWIIAHGGFCSGAPESGGYYAAGSQIVVEELLVDDSRQESLGVANLVSPPGQELLVLRNVTLRHSVRAPSRPSCVLFTPTQYHI